MVAELPTLPIRPRRERHAHACHGVSGGVVHLYDNGLRERVVYGVGLRVPRQLHRLRSNLRYGHGDACGQVIHGCTTVALPFPMAVARPVVLTVTTVALLVDQATVAFRIVSPFAAVATAMSCRVAPLP